MNRMRDAMSGPDKDPQFLQAALAYVASAWPQLYAAGLAFVVALVRGLHAGNAKRKSWLEAVMCGCLVLALFPLLSYFGLPGALAASIGAVISFMGAVWIRERIDQAYDKIIGRWLK
ncbi:Phage holin family (Lysis protein S) [Halomonas sp. THAF5a]|uniref:phage holin, lambda family n=1 Tax=Halomonas sp. THAF5a TaxID=2587844 RepID=UPI0012689AB1|nr:phage holin, lambda family [Halomonas sp. THAF5a]QFU01260.1 Phage holin family (Lysis protein S) [Halomonas sp. THAF5a]